MKKTFKHTPGRYAFFSSAKGRETGKEATFYNKEAFAGSQFERALDPGSCGIAIAGPGSRERIRYYFFQNFLPFWFK
jgi:hypothetical protein